MRLKDYIPNLESAYNALSAFLKENQGEKGYFRTDDDGYDTIWGYEYSYAVGGGIEKQVLAVRYNENRDGVEVFFDPDFDFVPTDEDFKNENNWKNLRLSDVYYRETLFNIIDYIEEYIDEN